MQSGEGVGDRVGEVLEPVESVGDGIGVAVGDKVGETEITAAVHDMLVSSQLYPSSALQSPMETGHSRVWMASPPTADEEQQQRRCEASCFWSHLELPAGSNQVNSLYPVKQYGDIVLANCDNEPPDLGSTPAHIFIAGSSSLPAEKRSPLRFTPYDASLAKKSSLPEITTLIRSTAHVNEPLLQ